MDELSRIARYLPFLRNHKDVMAHVREWESYEEGHNILLVSNRKLLSSYIDIVNFTY